MAAGILVKASVMGYFRHSSFFCSTTNIDKSGMDFECDKVLAKGDVIQCSLFLPGTGRVSANAEVTRISKKKGGTFYYCLRFLSVTPEQESSFEGALAEAALAEEPLVEAAA